MLGQQDTNLQKNKAGPLLYTILKNKLKLDQESKFKSQNYSRESKAGTWTDTLHTDVHSSITHNSPKVETT